MDKKVRVGIIGCGGIANGKHLPAIKKLAAKGWLEIVAFCDLIEERAERPPKSMVPRTPRFTPITRNC